MAIDPCAREVLGHRHPAVKSSVCSSDLRLASEYLGTARVLVVNIEDD